MKINDEMIRSGPIAFYEKSFRDTLEAHMVYFRTSPKAKVLDVEAHKAVVYAGDLFGYLSYLGIEAHHHWVIMRVNEFFSPYEFGLSTEQLLIPYIGDMESIRQSQKSTGSITV